MHHFFESTISPILTILHPRVIVEIGIEDGLHTTQLLKHCSDRGGVLHAIDPKPRCDVVRLQETFQEHFIFHKDLSLIALYHIDSYDIVLIDGDHNWYTVYHELLLIEKKAKEQGHFPLIALHDTGWPYGRRDLYYNPENIPTAYRQPFQKKGIDPASHTIVEEGGLNSNLYHSVYEHNVHNGVLTAIEDFIAQSTEPLHFQTIPGFSGLGIIASPTLLLAHPSLQEFLKQVETTPPITQHIASLDNEHLRHVAFAQHYQDYQQELIHVRGSRDRLDEELMTNMHEYRKRLREKDEEIARMTQTHSWRWTIPLRMGGSLLQSVSSWGTSTRKQAFHFLSTLLGSLLPTINRKARHLLFGRSPSSPSITSPPLHASSAARACAGDKVLAHDLRFTAIILCHDRGAFLQKTIESLLAQAHKCTEILIVDDSSTDETRTVALRYAAQEVEYLHGTWRNASVARNIGLRATESPLLVFLRPGDSLPPGYLQRCARVLLENSNVAVVYADRTTLESTEKAPPSPDPFDYAYFERENYVPDCSAVRRRALMEVGGWSHGPEQAAIWITWRRILANGWEAAKIPYVVWCSAHPSLPLPPQHRDTPATQIERTASLQPLDATLCLSLSGREWMWPLTRAFLERQTYPHGRTHLVIIDTSQDHAFSATIQAWLRHAPYGAYTYCPLPVGLKGLADLPRRVASHEVASACARIYAHFAPLCETPWVFFLEDDILPPHDVYPRLLAHFSDRTVSVSALCMQRYGPHPIAWAWDTAGFPMELTQQRGVTAVGGNGFCCVALRGEYVRNGTFHAGPGNFCHDHNFYRSLICDKGLQALLDWSCVCRHYISSEEWRDSLLNLQPCQPHALAFSP